MAALIVIGTLAYFGVFKPGTGITSNAIVEAPFYADGWKVTEDIGLGVSAVQLEIQNNGGQAQTITDIGISSCGSLSTSTVIQRSQRIPFMVNCTSPLTAGDKFKSSISVTYTKEGSNLPQTSYGSIADIVAP